MTTKLRADLISTVPELQGSESNLFRESLISLRRGEQHIHARHRHVYRCRFIRDYISAKKRANNGHQACIRCPALRSRCERELLIDVDEEKKFP